MMQVSRNRFSPRLLGIAMVFAMQSMGGRLLLSADGEATISFNRDIRPILSDHCYACHGFDAETREAELRLDAVEGATADLGGYRAIVPHDPERSQLWQRVSAEHAADAMPPEDFGKPLTEVQKRLLYEWIQQGADYEQHWSFVTPEKPRVPEIDGVNNPIDAFIQQGLRDAGLGPSPAADKATLIRRLSLDLTGLPPRPEEVKAFVEDDREDAYEQLVDEMQSRSSYGEHMGRYWLDLARYADTHGLHLDNERSMWPYRDWVVRAFNQNLPFDDFTRWQLAGDLLPNPTRDQLIASGFNRCNVTTSEGGSINEEWVYRYAVDRTSTAVEVWMGLTAGCAVCHDHKFDPLSTKEFYSLYAFFHSAADPAMDGNIADTPPILRLIDPDQEEKVRGVRSHIEEIEGEIQRRLEELEYADPAGAEPAPEEIVTEEVWFEDGFPEGAQPQASGGPELTLISGQIGPVYSGTKALSRTSDNQVSQDYFNGGVELKVPAGGRIAAYCYLDPMNPPQAIMLQFHTDGWKHRAVWGDADKIPFGTPDTTEKVHIGSLPTAGQWVRLEVAARRLGLNASSKVTGFAFTQFGGTVHWDRLSIFSRVDPATDPSWSWQVWLSQDINQIQKAFPDEWKRLFQGRRPDKWKPDEMQRVHEFWLRNLYAGARSWIDPMEAEIEALEKQISDIEQAAPVTFVMRDLEQPRESFVMIRGAYDQRGEKVSRSVPSFLPPLHEPLNGQEHTRLDLANWLLERRHPLTARVAVNRFWQQFFGTGLVETSADFGSQGQPPSHPELLDWLAVQFIEDGWDVKRLVKRIVTSHAYRQSSVISAEAAERDPDNRLLSRAPRLRLDAEVLRDQALFVGGLLVPTIGGPSVKPYQPPNIWEPVGFGTSNTRYYKQDAGDALYRRSLYTFLKRTAPPPYMSTFDAPNREQSCARRGSSNTPLQALQLMNDVQHVEAARAFGARMIQEGGESALKRIRWAWLVGTARVPSDEELQIVSDALGRFQQRYASDLESANALIDYGDSPPPAGIAADELAAYTMLANLILNLDETVSKN
jgi:hypothetical protein